MLLGRLGAFGPATVFDVGANVGDWSLTALGALPDARVHAFEIAPGTSVKLIERTRAAGERLTIKAIGLGAAEGEIELFYTPDSDTASSTVASAMEVVAANHGTRNVERLRVAVTTGDAYMRARGVDRIDFLKIDVEGAELSVLEGFAQAFDRGAIDVVQFEYGLVNLRTRLFLEEFHAFFEARGFAVGKLLPHGVAFKTYELTDEDFIGLNFVACRRARADILEAIRCPPLSLPTG
jgi:FkbM family methyltransferase